MLSRTQFRNIALFTQKIKNVQENQDLTTYDINRKRYTQEKQPNI